MAKNIFNHNVKLVPLSIENSERNEFQNKLNEVPYLLYEVEQLSDGNKIAINKPGGKQNFGRMARNDFQVFIHSPQNDGLWLISHNEILEDLRLKYITDKDETEQIIKGLLDVCNGMEPDKVIKDRMLKDINGISVETLLKVYKWIWGQEDCNYNKPGSTAKGRWLSMENILQEFHISEE